ncbi:hypothetical protein VIBNISOn1_1190026 [Vibrio nigripulchritudo SOn1]|uniref:Transposase n=1 Tax=Vibrio nigripulchritudo SOn1 TaxID=1238450 RepID=A0AAV2VJ44_9VIBR|nr:hypothetical protein VIBNISOn1_1190026 [Vibrio nigripulchritudo SOn1]
MPLHLIANACLPLGPVKEIGFIEAHDIRNDARVIKTMCPKLIVYLPLF